MNSVYSPRDIDAMANIAFHMAKEYDEADVARKLVGFLNNVNGWQANWKSLYQKSNIVANKGIGIEREYGLNGRIDEDGDNDDFVFAADVHQVGLAVGRFHDAIKNGHSHGKDAPFYLQVAERALRSMKKHDVSDIMKRTAKEVIKEVERIISGMDEVWSERESLDKKIDIIEKNLMGALK